MTTRRFFLPARASWLLSLLLLLVLVIATSACQRVSRQETTAPAARIELVAPLFAPVSGPATLHVEVTDNAGQPVQDATVSVRGDMTHAGMVPVFGEAERVRDGVYDIPFEWTMGGEWVLTVYAELSDGRTAADRFNVSVEAEGDQYRCTVTRAGTTEN